MKRIIVILLECIAVLGLQAQVAESMRIYTDKDCYLAGEDLWIKVCVTDSLFRENVLSKVAYIEICDTEKICVCTKIFLQDGNGWGRIRLPQTIRTGIYQLTAYTRYMRNYSVNSFPKKNIALLNAFQVIEENSAEVITDSICMSSVDEQVQLVRSDRLVYGNRCKVVLTLPELPVNTKELTLSVVRKDCLWANQSLLFDNAIIDDTVQHQHFVAECEGHIVTARLIGALVDSVDAQLSCVGRDIRLFDGQSQSDNTYSFYTTGLINNQNVVLTALPEKESSCRLEFVSPFIGVLPQVLPKLKLLFQKEALIERCLGVQIYSSLLVDSLSIYQSEDISGQLDSFTPISTYYLDEYTRFNTLRETILEFVKGVRISKTDDKTVIKILQPDFKQFSNLRTLVLLNGVPISDHEKILDFNAQLIYAIHRYSGLYTFGGEVYDGILSFMTYKCSLQDICLDRNSRLFFYEFPQEKPVFISPIYSSEEQIKSRIPDFRHTLYWNPEITPTTRTVSFYTSDMDGVYCITLQGVSAKGEMMKLQSEFIVK